MLSGKKAKGHRYSEHIKMLALSLYHTNPKCYKMLRKLFSLPCVSSLKRYMSRVDLQPGFHQQIIDGLKLKISDMAPSSKLCAIVFDEMAVKESLSYDVRQDCVEGLENFGCLGKTKYIANHASMFMVRRLVEKWKQPVGYFLSSGPMSPDTIKTLLFECIDKLQSAGLIVKVVICDQGSNNRSLLNKLGVSLTQPFFSYNNSTIYSMYDPPHLLKSIRNNLKKSGYLVGNDAVSWTHIERFYSIDSNMPIRMPPKLTAKHINLPPFSTMAC